MSKDIRNMKGLELFDYVAKNKEYISECCYLTECRSIDRTKRYATVLVSLDLDKMKGGDNLVAAEQRYHYDGKGSWVENPKYM